MTNRAIILAGGRATRLGPLTAQMNKALVTIGQRPILLHHIEVLRRSGIEDITVVVSPESRTQVNDVLDRSLGELRGKIRVAVQKEALGPVDAIRSGTTDQFTRGGCKTTESVVVLMADTYVDEPLTFEGDWIGTSLTERTGRSWCYSYTAVTGGRATIRWCEGVPAPMASDVAIGIYHFTSIGTLHLACQDALSEAMVAGVHEAPMAPMLNKYTEQRYLWSLRFPSWQDVGDVKALVKAKRDLYISRSFNRLEFQEPGTIRKSGRGPEFERERRFMLDGRTQDNVLFPRITDYGEDPLFYAIEYVDLPTLAELYLYWPGRPETWHDILNSLLTTLENHFWYESDGDPTEYVEKMYMQKTLTRLSAYNGVENRDWLVIKRLLERVEDITPILIRGHGDLNFSNILYSLPTMTFKLVDPRGDYEVDLLYELAKLRYSYANGFNAICHGLYDIVDNDVILGPQRYNEIAAMDNVPLMNTHLSQVMLIEACIFLSAAPLHEGREARAMYLRGLQLAKWLT